MFRLNLILKKTSDSTLVLQLPAAFRYAFAAICAFLVGSMVSVGQAAAAPLVLALISLAAAVYQERWVFATDRGTIEHHFGLLFAYRTSAYALDTVEELVIYNYREQPEPDATSSPLRGKLALKTLVSFGISTADGRKHTVEIRNARQSAELRENAEAIAALCGKALRVQE